MLRYSGTYPMRALRLAIDKTSAIVTPGGEVHTCVVRYSPVFQTFGGAPFHIPPAQSQYDSQTYYIRLPTVNTLNLAGYHTSLEHLQNSHSVWGGCRNVLRQGPKTHHSSTGYAHTHYSEHPGLF